MRLSHITIEYPDQKKFLKLLRKANTMDNTRLTVVRPKRLEKNHLHRSQTIMIM